jgi:hypothetical protein
MTRTTAEITSDMMRIENMLNCPIASKGKLSTLKAIMRKLITEYKRAARAA